MMMKTSTLATILGIVVCGGIAAADTNDPAATDPATTANPTEKPAEKPAEKPKAQATAPAPAPITGQTNPQPVDLFFDTDSATLATTATADLQQLADWARCHTAAAITLEGFADPSGSQAYNMVLSGKRAAMVREKLIGLGVPSDHIVVVVYGKNGPKQPTYAQARRVHARGLDRPIAAADLTSPPAG
jgi:outer membrane protein OmpA-like peptidoglycan-associated protein